MEIEYEAKVPESITELLNAILFKVRGHVVVEGNLRAEVIADLLRLKKWLNEPIRGFVKIEPEEVERAERGPYPDWYDMD